MAGLTATSSFCYQWTYDVFINFRGEDTRLGFTGNLYHSLRQKGIHTFLDDEGLRRGDEITPALLKAIENSRMAITVFSKNYASSSFCLNELVKIYQCIKRNGRLVLPIFYDVEPSEVRHQKENYQQALSMHRTRRKADEEKIQTWKLALHEVSNISGFHVDPRHDYEYQVIDKIVKEIYSKIDRAPLYVARYPVGLESRVLSVKSLLEIGSNEQVNMVGICGTGGIGKTTIARAVYNSVADNFDGMCFLHDIKESSSKLGLQKMQETMISKIIGVDIRIQDANEGVEAIKMRLKQKKILLILDNVDKHEHLEKLAGDCNWFSGGSRIIITTRNKHLLERHGVKRIYDMKALDDEESLELLNWNAFRSNQVNPSNMMVLNRAINYAKGLPLALEVIGSNMCGRNINECESALDAFKLIPSKDIQQVLKVSYDDLEHLEKEIFLDIACFFKGESLGHIKYMVEAIHGLNNPSYSIGVLEDKCLINIEGSCIEMHDLIQDMGREIVRQKSPNEPGKRSRLWFHKDIVHVLEDHTGTDEVSIIIQHNLSECMEVNWDGKAFKSMKNLKVLIFENVELSESPKYLPNSLKVLKWQGYPYSWLPDQFCPKNLVVFDLRHGCLSSLEKIERMKNLSVLKLEDCQYITEIPNLSALQNLKELCIKSCENLIEIHDSVGHLTKLEILEVSSCVRLETFPHEFRLPSLQELEICGCSNLKNFPEILENMKITSLQLVGTGIKKLPWSISNLTQLGTIFIQSHIGTIELPRSIFLLPEMSYINVEDCGKWESSIWKEAHEQAIFSMSCPDRVNVYLPGCNISDEILRSLLIRFINVTDMDLNGNNFTILPASIKECQFLKTLRLSGCKHLRDIEGLPPSIRQLEAIGCLSLSSESKSLLLESIRTAIKYHGDRFCVPATSIPDWVELDSRSRGSSTSFWYRRSSPPLWLFAHLKPVDSVQSNDIMCTSVYLNDRSHYFMSDNWHCPAPNVDHLIVMDLRGYSDDANDPAIREGKWINKKFRLGCRNDDMVVEEIGICLIEQLCKMKNIRFTDPYEGLDSTNKDHETGDSSSLDDDDDDDVIWDCTSSDDYETAESSFDDCVNWDYTSDDEFEQKQVTYGNVEQIPERSNDNRKSKGKEIVFYNDNINDK